MAGIRARGVVVLLMVCAVPAAAQTTAAVQGAARVVRHQAPTDSAAPTDGANEVSIEV